MVESKYKKKHKISIDYNTNLVARPLAEMFDRFDLMELHVSLSQGLWRYDKWGYPVGMFNQNKTEMASNFIRLIF